MVALYLSATHCTVSLDSATKQILVINHSFKKHSVKLEVKSQITLKCVQSCGQALSIRIALEIVRSLLLAFIYLNPGKYPLRAAPHRMGHGEGVPSPPSEMIYLLTHEVGKM